MVSSHSKAPALTILEPLFITAGLAVVARKTGKIDANCATGTAVASFTGARRNGYQDRYDECRRTSLPSRERGSETSTRYPIRPTRSVAPFTGAGVKLVPPLL